jgi:hypothetical protein
VPLCLLVQHLDEQVHGDQKGFSAYSNNEKNNTDPDQKKQKRQDF